MIINTTQLLPLTDIGIEEDLLKVIIEGRVKSVTLNDLVVSLISVFELKQNQLS